MYLPAFNVTEVPLVDPENDFGEGLLPDTVMVKSEGLLVPPLVLSTLVITLRNVDEPIGDVELFVEPLPPFEDDEDEDDEAAYTVYYWLFETKLAVAGNIINNVVTEIKLNLATVL